MNLRSRRCRTRCIDHALGGASGAAGWGRLHLIAMILVICCGMPPRTTYSAELPADLAAEVQEAFAQAAQLEEEFEYQAAARVLENLLTRDLPLETKVEINTRLASLYEQNLNERDAVRCLVENLRNMPSYRPPDSMRSRLQRLFARALEEYRADLATSNQPPRFTDVPEARAVAAGKELTFRIRAVDANGDTLAFGSTRPDVRIEDNGNGTATVRFSPAPALTGQSVDLALVVRDRSTADTAVVRVTVSNLLPPSPSPVVRSLLIPGWGQYTRGKRGLGTAFFIGEAAALGASVILTLNYNSKVQDYDDALAAEDWGTIDSKYDSVESAASSRDLAYIAAGAIWAVNIIHMLATNPSANAASGASATTDHPASGVSLAVHNHQLLLSISF